MKFLITFLLLAIISTNAISQSLKYFIKINNEKILTKKDSCNNISKIIMRIDRSDMDSFEVIYYPFYDEGVFFTEYQSKFYLRKSNVSNIVDYKWFMNSKLIKKIAFSEIKTKLFFIREYDKIFYEVFDAGILFSYE